MCIAVILYTELLPVRDLNMVVSISFRWFQLILQGGHDRIPPSTDGCFLEVEDVSGDGYEASGQGRAFQM